LNNCASFSNGFLPFLEGTSREIMNDLMGLPKLGWVILN
jgi:hypothetical protein